MTTPRQKSDEEKTILHEFIFWNAVWTVLGTAVMVIAHSAGWLGSLSSNIRTVLSGPPFLLGESATTVPPLSVFFISLAVTLFFVHSLLKIQGLATRLCVLVAATFLISLCTPICALWNVYLSPCGILLSLVAAGLGASVTACFLHASHPDSLPEPR